MDNKQGKKLTDNDLANVTGGDTYECHTLLTESECDTSSHCIWNNKLGWCESFDAII